MGEKLLKTAEAAALVGRSDATIRGWTRNGWLLPVRKDPGGSMWFREANVLEAAARVTELIAPVTTTPQERQKQVKQERRVLTEKQEQTATQAGIEEGLRIASEGFAERHVVTPAWSAEGSFPKSSPGTPVLFLSDIHAGEVVDPEQVNDRNRYGWEIMERRLETVCSVAAELLTRHLARPEYDGLVVVLGGDMVSGDIHDELKESNEYRAADGTIRHAENVLLLTRPLAALLAGHLARLADVFGRVYVVGVAGNHGRLDRKPRAKGYTAANADYHTYLLVQDRLGHDGRFSFNFPLARDVRFDVAGRRFLLTHGDQFRGGDGMIGPIGPIMRGDVRKRQNAALGLGDDALYDTLMCGHWHTTIMLPSLIVNGSLKGLDEFAAGINVRQERPSQTLFTVHPKHGITWYMPILGHPFL